MPRDPSGIRPQGALARHPADFFSDSLYVASWWEEDNISGSGEMYIAIGVKNEDNSGNVLRVWGETVTSFGGGGATMFFVKGQIGTHVSNGLSIRPDFPTPQISIWSQHQQVPLGQLNPFNFGIQFGEFGAPGFDSETVVSPFPLFIIPVGWSLVATTPQSSTTFGVTYWMQLTPR